MSITTTIRIAGAALVACAVIAPTALAGGEPKNEWPFTRPVGVRTTAGVTQVQAQSLPILGERKNQLPFTRPVVDWTAAAGNATGRPTGMSVQQYKAEMIRGDALNRLYGLGTYAGTRGSSAREGAPALAVDQSDAVSRYLDRQSVYQHSPGIGTMPSPAPRPDDRAGPFGVGQPATATPSSVLPVGSTGDGFDWADAGIGAAGMLGLVIAALGAVVLRMPRTRRPRTAGA
jgi:hypothetical protein